MNVFLVSQSNLCLFELVILFQFSSVWYLSSRKSKYQYLLIVRGLMLSTWFHLDSLLGGLVT